MLKNVKNAARCVVLLEYEKKEIKKLKKLQFIMTTTCILDSQSMNIIYSHFRTVINIPVLNSRRHLMTLRFIIVSFPDKLHFKAIHAI